MDKKAQLFILFHALPEYGIWDDDLWTPLQVGTQENGRLIENGRADNEGENISEWNRLFCENTGTYWIWKHLDYSKEFTGQVQYRRRFDIRSYSDLLSKMDNHKVITEQHLNFLITLRAQYEYCHSKADIDLCEEVVKTLYPDYAVDWDRYINGDGILWYSNGFIMRTEHYARYCEWLFPILFEMRKRMNFSTPADHAEWIEKEMKEGKRPMDNGKHGTYGAVRYQGVIFGFLSERLFTLYLRHNYKKSEIFEMPYLKMEKGI